MPRFSDEQLADSDEFSFINELMCGDAAEEHASISAGWGAQRISLSSRLLRCDVKYGAQPDELHETYSCHSFPATSPADGASTQPCHKCKSQSGTVNAAQTKWMRGVVEQLKEENEKPVFGPPRKIFPDLGDLDGEPDLNHYLLKPFYIVVPHLQGLGLPFCRFCNSSDNVK